MSKSLDTPCQLILNFDFTPAATLSQGKGYEDTNVVQIAFGRGRNLRAGALTNPASDDAKIIEQVLLSARKLRW